MCSPPPLEFRSFSRNPFWHLLRLNTSERRISACIPQFVNHANGHVFAQFVVLGAIPVSLNTTGDVIVTLLAGPLGRRIRESARFRRRQRTATGAIMIGLGTYLALGESK